MKDACCPKTRNANRVYSIRNAFIPNKKYISGVHISFILKLILWKEKPFRIMCVGNCSSSSAQCFCYKLTKVMFLFFLLKCKFINFYNVVGSGLFYIVLRVRLHANIYIRKIKIGNYMAIWWECGRNCLKKDRHIIECYLNICRHIVKKTREKPHKRPQKMVKKTLAEYFVHRKPRNAREYRYIVTTSKFTTVYNE